MNTKLEPIVSIIIPTYNHANFIDKALRSVIDQTFENWEAIVIDNHSLDETEKILKKYQDPRIKYLKIHNDGIIAKSRNLGIQKSRGEWIAFLDSDDWWVKDKLKVCLNSLNNKIDLIYHDLEIVDSSSNSFFKKKKFKGRLLSKPILKDLLVGAIKEGNAIGNSSVIVRKNILTKIGGINENRNLVASEDYNTWLRIAEVTDEFKYLKKKLGYYLVHDASTQKKNLSIPHKQAVLNFMDFYTSEQKFDLDIKWKYMSGCYNDQIKNYVKAKQEFIFVLRKGSFHFKLRSLLKIILILFK